MIYHALFVVNHTPYGLMVETGLQEPSSKVLEHAILAFKVKDYSTIKVLRDQGDVFGHRRHLGPYVEHEILKWIDSGCGVFQWHELIKRKPLPERKSNGTDHSSKLPPAT